MMERYKKLESLITDIQAIMGFDVQNGFLAGVKIKNNAGPDMTMPFYLVKTNGMYLISMATINDVMQQNIGVFLNSHPATDLVK